MSLQARVRTDSLGNLTVHVEGDIDFENSGPLRDEIFILTKENPVSAITFDLTRLEFVGSSGIGHFVEMVQLLINSRRQVQFANVRSEFQKVFKLYNFDVTSFMVSAPECEATSDAKTARRRNADI